MIMKNKSLIAVTFSLLVGVMTTQISAQDCGTNYSDCCNTPCDGGKFLIGAEWLYWKGEQDNMPLGLTIAGTTDQSTPAYLSTKTAYIQPNFKYTNGFRFNVGYAMPCDGWEANVFYTNLPIRAKSKVITGFSSNTVEDVTVNSGGGPFFSVQPNPYLLIYTEMSQLAARSRPAALQFQTFQQTWNLSFNQVDLDIGRTIVFNDNISIKPHAGFRALWYTDKQRAQGNGRITRSPKAEVEIEAENNDPFVADFKFNNKFTGYGIEAGLWGNWQLMGGLSLVGHFGGSVLYSKFCVNEIGITTVSTTQSEVTTETVYTATLCDTIHTATPTLDYFLGLEYVDVMCDMSFAIRAGWEQHVYFNTNRILQYGDLSTQGLSLGLEVGF